MTRMLPRSPRRTLLAPILVGVFLLVTVIAAAACGDDKDKPQIHPESADVLLHQALLSPHDLPGGPWAIVEDDEFNFGGSLAPDAVCNTMRAWFSGMLDRSTSLAQRRLELDPGPAVQVFLSAFQNGEAARSALTDLEELPEDDMATCIAESLKRVRLDSGVTVSLSTPSAAAPHDGFAVAQDRDFKPFPNAASRITAHAETYAWTQGNVLVNVDIIALQGVDITSLVTSTLGAVSESIDTALND
jgi:hypothetical protein